MRNFGLVLGSVLCFGLAFITHTFYTDYIHGQTSKKDLYFAWQSDAETKRAAQDEILTGWAQGEGFTARTKKQIANEFLATEYARQNCPGRGFWDSQPCKVDWKKSSGMYASEQKAYDEGYKAGLKKFEAKARSLRVYSGLTAADALPRKTRAVQGLWLGVVLPIVLVFTGLWLLATLLLKRRPIATGSAEPSNGRTIANTQYRPPVIEPIPPPPVSALVQMLRSHFGPDFPVTKGEGTEADPLVISRKVDYVSVEYVVAEHVIRSLGEEFAKEKQSLLHVGGKAIDELAYRVKPTGAPEWSGIRRFYFDITTGFNELGK